MSRGAFRVALLLAAAVLQATRAQGPQAEPSPRLEVEQDVVDLGQVVRGSEAKVTFVIRNAGTGVLKILGAKPG